MPAVDRALLTLDVDDLRRFLWRDLPAQHTGEHHAQHEIAWELGELFERDGLAQQAALCRSTTTHEILSVWRWTRSFPDVPDAFWAPAREGLGPRPGPPPRVALSLASARGLLDVVGDGLPLTASGNLPIDTVRALDDRFRWTEEFPWMRPVDESDLPPLRFLHDHLTAQRLLVSDGRHIRLAERGRQALGDTERLWSAVVDPAPRWTREFERDVLGVLAASLLRSGTFTPGRVAEEVTHVVAAKWRPAREEVRGGVFDGVSPVVHSWYQLGVPLGWWDTGRGPADRHPNVFGVAAAAAVFRASLGATGPGDARPG